MGDPKGKGRGGKRERKGEGEVKEFEKRRADGWI